jgi:molybdopterin converting factor small subunit
MPSVNVRFIGPWRLYLGIEHLSLEATTIQDVIEQIDLTYNPKYHETLRKKGITRQRRISDDSNIFLNRTNIRQLADYILKEGDNIDIIPRFAGG